MPWWDGMEEADILEIEATPTSHLVIEGKEIEVLRCKTDGGVVTKSDMELVAKRHKGHQFTQPVCLSRKEIEMIIQGVV